MARIVDLTRERYEGLRRGRTEDRREVNEELRHIQQSYLKPEVVIPLATAAVGGISSMGKGLMERAARSRMQADMGTAADELEQRVADMKGGPDKDLLERAERKGENIWYGGGGYDAMAKRAGLQPAREVIERTLAPETQEEIGRLEQRIADLRGLQEQGPEHFRQIALGADTPERQAELQYMQSQFQFPQYKGRSWSDIVSGGPGPDQYPALAEETKPLLPLTEDQRIMKASAERAQRATLEGKVDEMWDARAKETFTEYERDIKKIFLDLEKAAEDLLSEGKLSKLTPGHKSTEVYARYLKTQLEQARQKADAALKRAQGIRARRRPGGGSSDTATVSATATPKKALVDDPLLNAAFELADTTAVREESGRFSVGSVAAVHNALGLPIPDLKSGQAKHKDAALQKRTESTYKRAYKIRRNGIAAVKKAGQQVQDDRGIWTQNISDGQAWAIFKEEMADLRADYNDAMSRYNLLNKVKRPDFSVQQGLSESSSTMSGIARWLKAAGRGQTGWYNSRKARRHRQLEGRERIGIKPPVRPSVSR